MQEEYSFNTPAPVVEPAAEPPHQDMNQLPTAAQTTSRNLQRLLATKDEVPVPVVVKPSTTVVWVGNVPTVTQAALHEFMSTAGKCVLTLRQGPPMGNKPNRYATVHYQSAASVPGALELAGSLVEGTPITVGPTSKDIGLPF